MSYTMIFQRYEMKYLLTPQQKRQVLQAMEPYMSLDQYGRTTIRNIYFDIDSYRLIRRSLEKPAYKEKLRLRSYRLAEPDDPVFVELKKKYQSVVYKRRLLCAQARAASCLCGNEPFPVRSQIAEEIEYFRDYYRPLRPSMFLSYEREAYAMRDGGDFRVTFDENIRARQEAFTLEAGVYGTPLLPRGKVLMELKTAGGLPLWMAHCLSQNGIYQASFSKYGAAYQTLIQNSFEGGMLHA